MHIYVPNQIDHTYACCIDDDDKSVYDFWRVVVVRFAGIGYLLIITAYEKFEDSNRVIRCRKSKD
jgi:hypothetical protein